MNLVIVPFHDWKKCEHEGFRTRDAHFMQEFGRHPLVNKVLVINRPLSWAEMVLLKRDKFPRQGELLYRGKGIYLSQVGEKTYTLDITIAEVLRPLWMRRGWTPYIFGKPQIAERVRQTLTQLQMEAQYTMFLSAPLFVPLVQNLTPTVWAFDALDNLLKQSLYGQVPRLEQFYAYCLEYADVVSANSLETTQWFQEKRPDARWISNGVDTDMFSPHRPYSRPADMLDIDGLVVGYAGKMQEMFDMGAMVQALQALPEVSFVFIGQQLNREWVKDIWRYPNAHYLGDKPYHLLPQYLAAFDICIIPYSLERQHGGDPIKFYEYLAMGKPIVSANIGGVGDFKDYPQVCITNTAAEFVTGLKQMVAMVREERPFTLKSVPKAYLWQTKADILIDAMLTHSGSDERDRT